MKNINKLKKDITNYINKEIERNKHSEYINFNISINSKGAKVMTKIENRTEIISELMEE